MPGPRPTPTEELRRRGSWLAKVRPGEPVSATGEPSCPAHLDAEGKRTWRRIAKALGGMGVLSKDHLESIAGLASQYSLFVYSSKIVNEMKKDRDVDVTEFRKWAQVASDAFKNYLRACVEFGLTPSSKSRLSVPTKPATKDKGRFFAENAA